MIATYKFFDEILAASVIKHKIDEIKEKSKSYFKINKLLVKLVEIHSSEIQLGEDKENFRRIVHELDEFLCAETGLTLKNLSIDQIKSIIKNLRKVDMDLKKL